MKTRFCLSAIRLVVSLCMLKMATASAADFTWNNGSGDFLWNTTSLNWTSGSGTVAWNNAGGDGAVFGSTGVGTVNVTTAINVNSLNFSADGYTLGGGGTISFVTGTSTLGTGVVSVATGATATVNANVSSAVGFQKTGAGTLVLGGTNSFTGNTALTSNGVLRADVIVGTVGAGANGGTLRVASQAALPASTNVAIGYGYLDIGANNITVNNLTFTNITTSAAWNTTLNANNGVVGSGTLRVTGEINVIGVTSGNSGNSIAANVDLGGGTQVLRIGVSSSFGLNSALMFTGTLSNGSLLKSIGYTTAGVFGSVDGISLFGNNTYTGATLLNSGTTVATGTNASTSIKVGGLGGPGGSNLTLQGANGSFLSAGTILVFGTSSLILDNNAALGASGNNQPNIPAAQNNNRLRDDVAIELRDGLFTYRGQSTVAATETVGSLNASGGHNTITITPNGTGGTATLTFAGNLTLASRATLLVSATTLSAAGKVFVNGTLPTADATGILPRMVGSSDFLIYNGTTGLTPYTGYATDFSAPNTNVAITAAPATVPTVTINALKTTSAFTTTIGTGNTLTVTSGMILNTSGTQVITGGTLAFGSTPGTFFTGTTNVSSAITGSNGLIVASGTAGLSGDLSGLTGTITINNGTATLSASANTFTGPIIVRTGTLNFNVTQTGAGLGTITLGVPETDANLFGGVPTFSFSGAGANAVIDRPILIDNGTTTLAGVSIAPAFSLLAKFTPLSNATGSQTLNGNITLNTSVNLQGGAAGGTGATNFGGTISGAGTFVIPNGRVNFTATSTVSNTGGFLIGNTGQSAQVSFLGTTSGNVPISLVGGNTMFVSYAAGSLPTGTVTSLSSSSGSTAASLTPLATSSINNAIVLTGDLIGNPGTGVTGTWAGILSGNGTLTKSGAGTLVLSNASNSHTGPVAVGAGTLLVNGTVAASSNGIAVNSGGSLGGTGTINRNITVAAGGTLAPGAGIGTTTVIGNTTVTGAAPGTGAILAIDVARGGVNTIGSNDVLAYTGTVNFAGLAAGTPTASDNKFRIVLNDAAGPLVFGETYSVTLASGTGQIQRNGTQVNSTAYTFDKNDYQLSLAGFTDFNSLSLIANTNGSVVLTFVPVPEPVAMMGLGALALGGVGVWNRRRFRPAGNQ